MRLLLLRLLGASLALGLIAGCSCDGPRTATQVIVVIDADDGVRAAASHLHVEVFGGPAGMTFPDAPRADQGFPVSEGSGWPRTLALAPENRDASRLYRVVATGEVGAGGAPVAVARVISGYVAGSVRMVRLYLRSSCAPDECEEDETCGESGTCVSAYIPPDRLPEYMSDGGMPVDAGPVDAPRMDGGDGGGDAGPTCPGGCDDGVDCTVDECVGGVCQHRADDTMCDDGVSCTVDACDETAGCSNTADDGMCADDGNECTAEVCDAMDDCRSVPVMAGIGCDDGLFCTGGEDACDGTGRCVGGADPCTGMLVCNEATDSCDGSCADDSGCPPDSDPAWSACAYTGGTCDNTGSRMRTVTTFTCTGGMCVTGSRGETDSAGCNRVTDGTSCGTGSCSASGPCAGFSGACGESGTRPTTCTDLVCGGGTCGVQTAPGPDEACSRDTDGFMCGSPSCTTEPCMPLPGECPLGGTALQTCVTPVCRVGSCTGTSVTMDTTSCTYNSDGDPCGVCPGDRCSAGICVMSGDCTDSDVPLDGGMDAPIGDGGLDAGMDAAPGRISLHLNEIDWVRSSGSDFVEVHNTAPTGGSIVDHAIFVVVLPSCMPASPVSPLTSIGPRGYATATGMLPSDSFGVALIRDTGTVPELIDAVAFSSGMPLSTSCFVGGTTVPFDTEPLSDGGSLASAGHRTNAATDPWQICSPTPGAANSCP